MRDRNLLIVGIIGSIVSILTYLSGFWAIALLIIAPSLILISQNESLSKAIAESFPKEFNDESFFSKANPFTRWISIRLDTFESVHVKSAVICLIYTLILVSAIIVLIVLLFLAFAVISSNSSSGKNESNGRSANHDLPPTVIFPDQDTVVGSLKRKNDREWVMRYGPRSNPTEKALTITRGSGGEGTRDGMKFIWQ